MEENEKTILKRKLKKVKDTSRKSDLNKLINRFVKNMYKCLGHFLGEFSGDFLGNVLGKFSWRFFYFKNLGKIAIKI